MKLFKEILSKNPEETLALAREFSKNLTEGNTVAFLGELGSGKTCFIKGLIHQLTDTPQDEITSPTFTLVEQYSEDPVIYHVDLYRAETPESLLDLPWDEFFDKTSITLIEWAENLGERIDYCQWQIQFDKGNRAGERCIKIYYNPTLIQDSSLLNQ